MYAVIRKSYQNPSSTRGPTVVCQSRERCIILLRFKSSKELHAFSEMFQCFWESALQKITSLNLNFNRALNWLKNKLPLRAFNQQFICLLFRSKRRLTVSEYFHPISNLLMIKRVVSYYFVAILFTRIITL